MSELTIDLFDRGAVNIKFGNKLSFCQGNFESPFQMSRKLRTAVRSSEKYDRLHIFHHVPVSLFAIEKRLQQ
jgi:hypothetical protein